MDMERKILLTLVFSLLILLPGYFYQDKKYIFVLLVDATILLF